MTLRSNPRLLVFALALPTLLAAGIAMFPLLGPVYGIGATAFAAFVDWTMLKILRRQMKTTVTVDEGGAWFNLYGEEKVGFSWSEIALVGLAIERDKRGRRARELFFYKEDGDRLMVVPAEFERFAELEAETRRHAAGSFRDLEVGTGETLKDRLRGLLLATAPGGPPESGGPAAGQPAAGAPGPG
jgi:hypothetical protein